MPVADRQGGILKPCIPLQDAGGGGVQGSWASVWWGRNFSWGGSWFGVWGEGLVARQNRQR